MKRISGLPSRSRSRIRGAPHTLFHVGMRSDFVHAHSRVGLAARRGGVYAQAGAEEPMLLPSLPSTISAALSTKTWTRFPANDAVIETAAVTLAVSPGPRGSADATPRMPSAPISNAPEPFRSSKNVTANGVITAPGPGFATAAVTRPLVASV